MEPRQMVVTSSTSSSSPALCLYFTWQQCPCTQDLTVATTRVGGMMRSGSAAVARVTSAWYSDDQNSAVPVSTVSTSRSTRVGSTQLCGTMLSAPTISANTSSSSGTSPATAL